MTESSVDDPQRTEAAAAGADTFLLTGAFMASQEQWRQIRHQEWLGQQGKSTGTSANDRGLQQFRQNQARQKEAQAATAYTPPKAPPAADRIPQAPRYQAPAPTLAGGPISVSHGISRGRPSTSEWGGRFVGWFMSLWPLRAVAGIGRWLAESPWPVKLTFALSGGVLAALIAGNAGVAPPMWVVAIGCAAGWFTPAIVGRMVQVTAFVVASLLAVAAFVVLIAIAYGLIVSVANAIRSRTNGTGEPNMSPVGQIDGLRYLPITNLRLEDRTLRGFNVAQSVRRAICVVSTSEDPGLC